MEQNQVLQEILKNLIVYDELGNSYPLDSHISEQEGNFLTKLINENQPKITLEVGCAYGISSLYICSALAQFGNVSHTIIDPFQTSQWKNIGILNLKKAGYNFFELTEHLSEIALPRLLEKNKKIDFCFIDGNHTFDHVLLDFFYINRLIDIGGIIVFDDIGYPSINKLMRYLLNYPCYELIGKVEIPPSKKTVKGEIKNFFIYPPLKLFSKIFTEDIRYQLFSSKIILSDKKLGLNTSMIALKKIKNDDRDYKWFKDF